MSAIGDASVIVGCTAASVGVSEVSLLLQKKPSMKPIIGGMILGMFLLFIAMFSSDIATVIAIMVLVASVITNGSNVFAVVTKVA